MAHDQIEYKTVELNGTVGNKLLYSQSKTQSQFVGEKRGILKKFLTTGLMSLTFSLVGCMIVDSPIKGVMGTEVIWGDVAGKTAPADTQKQGKACAESILGLFAHGDASVRAAKENGGITEVSSVDHSARNFLNIVGEWCTLVRGN